MVGRALHARSDETPLSDDLPAAAILNSCPCTLRVWPPWRKKAARQLRASHRIGIHDAAQPFCRAPRSLDSRRSFPGCSCIRSIGPAREKAAGCPEFISSLIGPGKPLRIGAFQVAVERPIKTRTARKRKGSKCERVSLFPPLCVEMKRLLFFSPQSMWFC